MAAMDDRYRDGKFLVSITNSMLEQLHVADRVTHWSDINAHIFVIVFEGLTGEPLRDLVRPARSKEDEIHNVQAVIDTLSLDILHVSLSHITGEDVVSGNKRAIANLVEVIIGLLEYIIDDIGSDGSSLGTDETREMINDPDLITGEYIDEVLERELNKKCNISDISRHSAQDGVNGTSRSDHVTSYRSRGETTGNSTAELIALGRTSQEDISRISGNNTADLVALGDSRYTRGSPPRRGPLATYPSQAQSRLGQYDPISTGVKPPPAPREAFTESSIPLVHNSRLRDDSVGYISHHDSVSQGPSSPHLNGMHNVATSPIKTVSPNMDSSVASSVALPQHPAMSGVPPSSEFAGLGMRPRSTEALHGVGSGLTNGIIGSGGVVGVSSSLNGPGSSSFTHHLYHHFDKPADRAGVNLPDFSSSLPLESSGSRGYSRPKGRSDRIEGVSTMPHSARADNRNHTSGLLESGRSAMLGSKAHSYDNLQNLMHDTVAMSRAAVRTSPLRTSTKPKQSGPPRTSPLRTSQEQQNRNGNNKNVSAPQRETKSQAGHRPAPTSTTKTKSPVSPKGICSSPRRDRTDRANKKVSFHVSRASTDQSQTSCKSDSNTSQKKSQVSSTVSNRPRQTNTSPRHLATYPGPTSSKPTSTAGRRLFTMPPKTDRKAITFAEYLDKYYGIVDKRDRLESTEDENGAAVSDSVFDLSDGSPHRGDEYSGDADVSEDVDGELLRQAARRSVRFEGFEADSAPGRMGSLRQKLNTEGKKSQVKSQALARLYNMELGDYEEEAREQLKSTRAKSKETERNYKKKILRQPKINKSKSPKKTSVLRPRIRPRSTSAQPRGRKPIVSRGRKRSASASPAVGRRRPKNLVHVYDDDLLPRLLGEFPYLDLSKETLHQLWSKSTRQLEQLTRAQQEVRRKKSKGQAQIDEAVRKHDMLKDIMKRELAHNQRLKEIKDRQNSQQTVRTQLRNRRQQSARARRYYDEFQVRNRSRMLKKKTRDELIFKKLFKDGLDIHRERIRDMRRYAKDERERRAKKQKDELEAIENYYHDQFAMMSEIITQERKDLKTKDQAQSKVMQKAKREMQQKMESEIRVIQEQMYRDEDEEYFRQLDADCLRQHLMLARYEASV